MVGSWRRLLGTAAAVLALSAGLSHLTAAALGVRFASVSHLSVRPDLRGRPLVLLGSSITLYGLDQEALATAIGRPLTARFVPSGSPAELETLQAEVDPVSATVVGLSIYDMNELVLADRRPELVPIRRAVADLREAGADWPFTKRVLGQYLLHGATRAFPTAGKSDLVMVGVRRVAREAAAGRWPFGRPSALRPPGGGGATPAILFDPRGATDRERTLDSWPREERLRNIANYGITGRDRHAFFGPKFLALRRLATAAVARGETVVVVFPVSPPYAVEFLDAAARVRFEQELAALATAAPAVVILRLDLDPALQSERAFRDLVHLGPEGRRHATDAVATLLLRR
jgi:hypothetical protein